MIAVVSLYDASMPAQGVLWKNFSRSTLEAAFTYTQ